MSALLRITSLAASATAAALSLAPVASASAAVIRPASPLGQAALPGRTGKPIVLDNNVQLSGYDVATDRSGRTYLGWISDENNNGRKVHLCTLPPGARQCQGGIQTIDSLGDSTATGLRVLVTPGGQVTLVWFHDTTASENGPQGSEIATATSDAGGPLSAPADVATGPSFGTMLDATQGPNGSIWVVTEASVAGGVQVRPGLSSPFVNLTTPYGVGGANLRFDHGTGVLVIQQAGAISEPVAFASYRNGAFTSFRKLAHTWTADANVGLTDTSSGIRMITSVDNASYYPEAWSWTGSGFGQPTLTGDLNACTPSSHDLTSDSSGRAADAAEECGDVAIANLTDTRHAAVVRFSAGGTFAGGDPQLTTTPRGTGWVAWSIESSAGDKLLVAPVLLPGRAATASAVVRGNRVIVTGPASCLPPVDVKVSVKARPARGWHVTSTALRLGSTVLPGSTLHGGTLTPGKLYTLSGTASFAGGGSHATATAKLSFRSCPRG